MSTNNTENKNLKTKGLTVTILFEAQSLNYDEGYGNLSVIKKFHRGSGDVFSYSSRQSLRYSIFMQGHKEFGWKPSKVEEAGAGDQKVTQLVTNISESEESDLFGYMRTNVSANNGKEISVMRTTPVRIMPAIAVEPFANDIEMLTNKYQADKIPTGPNIANIEMHKSLYCYTISIDLHRVGTETDEIGTRISPGSQTVHDDYAEYEKNLRTIDIGVEEKTKRVKQLLDVVKMLYRDIRGRREDLKPLFIIGGVYDTCNPFFENLVKIDWQRGIPKIILEPLRQIINSDYSALDANGEIISKSIMEETYIGIREGIFDNSSDVMKLFPTSGNNKNSRVGSPEYMIDKIKAEVANYYNIKQ